MRRSEIDCRAARGGDALEAEEAFLQKRCLALRAAPCHHPDCSRGNQCRKAAPARFQTLFSSHRAMALAGSGGAHPQSQSPGLPHLSFFSPSPGAASGGRKTSTVSGVGRLRWPEAASLSGAGPEPRRSPRLNQNSPPQPELPGSWTESWRSGLPSSSTRCRASRTSAPPSGRRPRRPAGSPAGRPAG